jgi:hypothetical protein
MCINCGYTFGCTPTCGDMLAAEAKGARFQTLITGLKVAIPDRPANEAVDHPQHYGGKDDPYEVIKVMIAWDAEMAYHFCVGNAIKYFGRLGKKDPEKRVEDLKKAGWYASKAAEIYEEHLSEAADVKRPLGIRQDGTNDV